MKAIVWHGAFDVRFEDVPVPTPQQGEALLRVGYAGVCGSDLTIYAGKHWRSTPPMIMGHEFAGEIVEIRGEATSLKVGDRVAVEPLLACGHCHVCREGAYHVCQSLRLIGVDVDGGFAEYVKAPLERIYPLPVGTPMERAAMVEPASVAVHDVRRSRLQLGDHAVVLGGGPIGLLVAQVARLVSSRPVDLVEVSDWRLDLARKMGFDPIDAKRVDVTEEVLRRTGGKGADILFDAAGAAATADKLAALTRIHGQVVIVAMPKEHHPVDLAAFALREIDLTGCRVYNYRDYRTAIDLIASGKIDVESMVSHVMPLERGKEALDLARKGDASMKVLLKP
ncbi:MAG: zinc-dependent alcohol dehydrogenase [Sphingomonadaceae bacterium]